MKHMAIYLLLTLTASVTIQAQTATMCHTMTNRGNDFWFMFLYNMNIYSDTWESHRQLIVSGDQSATINVVGPSVNESFNLTGNSYNDQHEYGNNHLIVATPYNGGYHLTSSNDIYAYTRNYVSGTHDIATLLPSSALDTIYIVQDFPSQQYGGEVGFVATEDNTVLSMTVPCNISGTTITAGTTLNPVLQQGQAYLLLGVGSLSGMVVTSNGKPFAMFQGAWNPAVPENSGGRDHMYEQALPIKYWGTDFIVPCAAAQTGNNCIRITASEDSCTVTLDSISQGIINAGQTLQIYKPASGIYSIHTSKPAMVALYLTSYAVSGGDPASVIIPPLDRGVCESHFVLHNTSVINSHYVNIVCDSSYSNGLHFDGNPVPATPITHGRYKIYRFSTTAGYHQIENSSGPFVAYAYAVAYYEGCAFPLGFGLDTVVPTPPVVNPNCSERTLTSTDFWVTFITNGTLSETQFSLLVTGLDDATVNVVNPRTGWSTSATHTGGSQTHITLPSPASLPSASAADFGFHVTSTADISLFESNYRPDSWDLCCVIPTEYLSTTYLVQDYPNNSNYPGGMALLAVEDGTTLTMTLPCTVNGLSLPAGSTYTVSLDAGQSLALHSPTGQAFSGMRVTSNGKPFALFQGHSCARVGTDDEQRGRDHMVEQAIPLDWWGQEFVVVSEQARTEGDRIRITAATDNSHVHIAEASGNVDVTLQAGETHEYHLPPHSAAYITSDHPVYVCKYLISFDKFNPTSLGDPASVDIPPVHNWLCSTTFPVYDCNTDHNSEHYIQAGHHYFDLVTTVDAIPTMQLDGTTLPAAGFTFLAGTPYCYYHGTVNPGAHTLSNNAGPFYATVSAHSRWVAYSFLTGMALEPLHQQLIHDTVHVGDTVCQGEPYSLDAGGIEGLIFIPTDSTAQPGTLERWADWVEDDTLVHHIHLLLTVLPAATVDTSATIILGDTLLFQTDTLTRAGDYTYRFTAANGCDSTLTLHLAYESIALTASADGLCPGDSAILTASGVHYAWWSATPPDPALGAQQGQTAIVVAPDTTTVYALCADSTSGPLAVITVGVEPPPTLCVELSRPFIDFDHPVVIFTDCSQGSDHSLWTFSDGYTIGTPRARRQFHHPLPDSVEVTLRSCNQWNCCRDTTFSIDSRIRSVWFPNVFTPGGESNQRFGATLSFEAVEFELLIFNRLGLLIYRTDDPAATWDGTHDGRPVPQGAYVYHWHVRDTYDYNHTGIGTVTLLR